MVRAHSESLFFFDLENGGRTFGSAPLDGDQMPTNWQAPRVDPEAVASIIFTSGMLVEPRGVMLRHRNFIADLLALAEVHQVYDSDQVLSMLPLHHGLEFTGGLLMPLLGGATITYLETLNSRDILKTMRATGTTAMLGVPRIFKILIDRIQRLDRRRSEAGETTSARDVLRPLRLVVSGGAPLVPEIFAAYQELGISICEGYGLTEAGPIVAVNPPEHARSGSVGQALPRQEIDIDQADEEGRGEILIRGANVMAGYFEQAELTDEVLRDGWLHSGDIGYLDGDGYLFITGRSKNLIVTGAGKNIYPEEVEELYRSLPQVAELSVVGVQSPRTLSEEVHAVAVVERDSGDVRDVEALKEEIVQRSYQISRSLPTYQRIQRLHIWERPLPRLDSGSVDRDALLAELQLAREELRDIAEIDESLPPWERQVYGQISQITGLSVAEVVAHVEAPLDILLDSLMAVEFAALVEDRLGVDLSDVDRGNHTLRMVLDRLEPHVEGKVEALAEKRDDEAYWSNVLGGDNGEVEALQMGVGKRLLQGLILPLGSAFFRAYFSLEARGLEHLPQGRPYLIAANHCSHLDAPSLFWALQGRGERPSLVAAQDYFFRSPLRSWFLRTAMNAIPFERYGDFKDSLRTVRSFLGAGRPLLIFPEGTRSLSGQLQPFKTGVGLLALELDVPIVPVHIQGTYEAFPKGSRKPSRGAVSLLFGEPMQMAAYRERLEDLSRYEVYREVVEALRREIERLSGENGNG